MPSQLNYKLTIMMRSRFTFQTEMSPELYSYLCSWLKGTWPHKTFNIYAIDKQYILTDPSNIEIIEIEEVK